MSTARRVRTAILISGRGSNMIALIEAATAADFPAEIVLVAANLPDAGGLERAAAAGIATASVDHRPFGKDREAFERALDAELQAHGIELVVLAGFMRVLTSWFVTRWQGRMINIHPSLLPDFRGTHTHARALEAGVAEHGCTVHFVVPELDAGPTILQARVPVLPGDDEASLSARVLEQEHRIYPQALALVASGAARLEDGTAVGA
ncbi:phosphoribosylglycinamide formyltransferase 1 [Bosea sp. 62]|uniref:phosphoribosylglycinamide formyltransferase n=1 Tax=unclassified Bosea (in: a-proteobacteria) TaxID=2653178 RepID=UPI00125C8C7C|nr:MULTISPECIES: phosphoribosylglycinamide formyltransferase [unclassified Bosea (in: a-proteobacteria)]CAD5256278.1 phosphoribosylglycinamide formyltransferase 1 [Bosea sp. 46]CAD5260334.1 phosphoribosylglycinamide formyltransferase 1 [Bosea sp. 21B]CAD5280312.1 phosphoribosylglycinamide formyltransferase 1 [Bosea sp. 7B]VVT58241.1 phosphoribosylglycinamide formyltransferase 1 [Bosea sp. EC-HK365B]VXB49481.1 phosphoribosylglycinamide formyltransferase 1 [Bosea sp. 29B]